MEAKDDIKGNSNTKSFLKARYKESLRHELHDVQLYFYYTIKVLGFDDIVRETTDFVLQSQNQILIAYYLKDNVFSPNQISSLKTIEGEEYWFQNYHLILYTNALNCDLNTNIKKYLIPERLVVKPNTIKEKRYYSFYYDNLKQGHALINDISKVTDNIKKYLELRYEETAEDFGN